MSADVIALIVAIVGVAGTLASALLTQASATRAKRLELDEQRRQRLGELDEERRRTDFKDRRDCCVALNMAGRRFRQALKNCLFEGMGKRGDELEQARLEFTSRYGEAQMILPDAVLDIANAANKRLAQAYGKVKASQQPAGPPPGASEREKLEAFIEREVAPVLWQMQQAMRRDLGVSDQDQAFDSAAAAALEDGDQ